MSSGDLSMVDTGNVQVIEWNMLDKWKFLPMSVVSVLSVRSVLYPFVVVKTRIQVHYRSENYRGTFSTFRHILANEGWKGLYRGFLVSGCQVFSNLFYLATYEKSRELLLSEFAMQSNSLRALIAGGCASAASQLIVVPFDVISQHLMVLERPTKAHATSLVPPTTTKPTALKTSVAVQDRQKAASMHTTSKASHVDSLNLSMKIKENPGIRLVPLICREIYLKNGLKGFYNGYLASLLLFAPSSAMFWGFYHFYYESLRSAAPSSIPHLVIQGISAPISGATIAVFTNPIDLFRCNLQVHGEGWKDTMVRLYESEGWRVLNKGLPTRLITIPISSFLIIVGYELVKRLTVHENYKSRIQW